LSGDSFVSGWSDGSGVSVGSGSETSDDNDAPQAVQNRAFATATSPHAAHAKVIALPQLWQKFDPAGLAAPHSRQLTLGVTNLAAFMR